MKKIFAILMMLCGIMILSSMYFSAQYSKGSSEKDDYKNKRMRMVDRQIKERGVTNDRVLKAMRKVKRHLFVPEDFRQYAYEDRPLPIGQGQTISQPYIVGLMTQMLDPHSDDKILEVGTGSGYQAAVLAGICDTVYTVEIKESLAKKAINKLNNLGYDNVKVKIGDGYQGWPAHAPFDAIIVTAAPSHIPDPLKQQLKEGGHMAIPVGEGFSQELLLLQKKGGELKRLERLSVRFVPLIDKKGSQY